MEQSNVLNDLTIDASTAEQIRGFAGWAKFLSIIGFILSFLMLILGIFAGSIFSSALSRIDRSGEGFAMATGVGTIFTFVYVIVALIYFFPTLFLFQASVRLRAALNNTDQQMLTEGFRRLRRSFKFVGILTIIIISLYLAAFLISLLSIASE